MVKGDKKSSTATRVAAPKVKGHTEIKNVAPPAENKSRFWLTIAIIAVVFLALGSLVPLNSGKKAPGKLEPLPKPVSETVSKAQPVTSAADPAGPLAQQVAGTGGRQGLIIVPNVGLRTKASIDAKPVSRVTLRHGERVTILKRQAAGSGPSWMQVETKAGKVGWVFASVVKETRSRR